LIILILPYRITLFIGGFLGSVAYTILPKYRNITLENLRLAFNGEKDIDEINRIARDVFRNLGRTAAECLSLQKLNTETIKNIVREEDYQPLKEILSKGKGIIVIGSHYGNWEMSSIGGVACGLDVTVIARRIYYPPYNKFLVSLREDKGVKTLYRDDKNILRKSLNILKSNKVLGVVADQDVDSVDGVFVNFFGRPAYTPVGPVVMAMLSGAPLVPTFMIRNNGRFRLFAEDPIYIEESGNRKQDIIKYTQKWSDVIEKHVRTYPSHWVWMHKRWKTKPEKIPS
jgi:KDO2-lipid IV(A) lauroyltransferase